MLASNRYIIYETSAVVGSLAQILGKRVKVSGSVQNASVFTGNNKHSDRFWKFTQRTLVFKGLSKLHRFSVKLGALVVNLVY